MKPHRLASKVSNGVLVALAACMAVSAFAQNWPVKPARIVVPFVPGGGTDIQARLLGKKFFESTGQSFVVENRGGAGGAPASSEQGSRLRDVNVRESGCAPLDLARVLHPSPGSHPLKGHPCSDLDGA